MSRITHWAAALAAATVLTLGSAIPASAHDELVNSTPAPGENLTAVPSEVVLTFSADVLTMGAAIIIADADGNDWAVGEPAVEGGVVTVETDADMPSDAGYEVRWRVVSGDGHPISGAIPFTVGDGEPLAAATPAATPEASESADAHAHDGDEGAAEDARIGQTLLIGGIGAAVALSLLGTVVLLRRRGTRSSADDASAPSATQL